MDFVSQMQSAANREKRDADSNSVVSGMQEEKVLELVKDEAEIQPEPVVIEESSEEYRKQRMEKIHDEQGYLKTSDIAEYLNCSPQMARNYVNDFAEFLTIEKTSGGHRKYSLKDAAVIHDIVKIRRDKGFTVEQTKEYLRTPTGRILKAGNETAKMEMLFEWLADEMKKQVAQSIESMENSFSDSLASIEAAASLFLEQRQEMPTLEQKQEMDLMRKELDSKAERNQILERELAEKNQQIMRLIDEQDRALKALEELKKEPEKKKGFLFFRKN